MKKRVIYLLMILILINISFGNELVIQTYEDGQLNVLALTVISKNNYYLNYYNNYTEKTDYIFRFLNDNDVFETPASNKIYTILDFQTVSDFESFQIIKNNDVISTHTLNFCNNNGICEPCNSPDCEMQENELTCTDCEPSSNDNYCNIKEDNVCDLDCQSYEYEEESVYEDCFEENLRLLSCSDYFGKTCVENQVCNGTQLGLETSEELCCLGECVESEDIYIFDKNCGDFFWKSCEENQVCDGEEIYLDHNNQTCCTTKCESSVVDTPIVPEQKKDYTQTIIISLIIISVILLILVIVKKKAIKISIFIFLIATSAILFTTFSNKNQITGNVVSQVEQAQMVCEVAKAYNLPPSYLLAIAYKESGVNHYNGDGSLKISTDGGVGMMQVDRGPKSDIPSGPFYACGYSNMDGRKLDAKQLKDNIECGAIELIGKCNSLSCINNKKQYYCANEEINLPPKNVIYSDWDIAIRAYNGWGCGSDFYRSSMGVKSAEYLNLAFRIQSYVEDFRQVEKQFQGYCGESLLPQTEEPPVTETSPEIEITPPPPPPTQDTTPVKISEEIKTGEKIGFYYINPSFRILSPDLNKTYGELAFSPVLIKETLSCKEEGNSYTYCIKQSLINHGKTNWNIDDIDETQGIVMFSVDSGYEVGIYNPNYVEKPLVLKFALTITEKGTEPFPDLVFDEVTYDNNEETEETSEENKPYDEPEKISETCIDKDTKIVLFGDSITQMHYDYGNYLQAYFNQNFNSNFEVLITQGLGGMRVDNQKSIDMFNNEILPSNPDIVLMWFGMNSLEDYPSVHQTTYQSMIETMLSKGITPILITTSPTCSEYTDRNFEYLNNIIQIDKNLANYYDGVYLIDFREEFNKVISVSGCGEYFADGYHMNSKGHDLFAQIVVKKFIEWKNAGPGPFVCQ